MILERDAVAGNRIETRQSIVRPRKQPVGPLVNDQENDVVRRLAAGVRANRSAFLSLQDATSEHDHQAHECQESQATAEELPFHVRSLRVAAPRPRGESETKGKRLLGSVRRPSRASPPATPA